MRLTSNKESVAKGEVSVLAIVETLLAIALVFYLSAHFNTLRWLAVAMCVSPLLLLRTEESTRLGIKWFDNWPRSFLYEFLLDDVPWQVDYIIALPVVFAVRVAATFAALFGAPMAALNAIPKNWARITLATDTLCVPEPIPEHPTFTFGAFKEDMPHGIDRVFEFLLFGPFLLPALIYRWSLKATSIIYAPLVFVAYSTFSEGTDLRTKLELIKRSDLTRIRALYGVVFIAAFLVKLVLMMKWSGFVEAWRGSPITEFLSLYIAPPEIPKWQLAELLNSVLAVGAMLFARHALLRYGLNHPYPEKPMKRILGFVSGVRWVLVVYAIVCIGYITMREAHNWHWPALGTKWLPFW
jgi:hypothetical protein